MRLAFNAFTAGELSPKLAGRGDLPGIAKGCLKLRNFIPRVTGGVFRRPGTKYQFNVKDTAAVSRLIPFNFSADDSILLEMADLSLRFAREGVLIGAPYVVTAPWTTDELFAHQYVQVNDVMYFAHQSRPPQVLTRIANDNWSLDDLHDLIADNDPANGFPWPAMRDENSNGTTLTADATTGTVLLTSSADVFVESHVGAFFQIAHRRDAAFDELEIPVLPAASATLNITTLPTAGQTVSIGGITYTWKSGTTVTGPYHVYIGADASSACENLAAAINASTASPIVVGVEYGVGTSAHPDVTATSGDVLNATSATGTLTGNGTNSLCPSGDNVEITVGTLTYRFEDNTMGVSGSTYDVNRGSTERESLENMVKAINLTGTANNDPAIGNYTASMIINPDVSAALNSDNTITLTAKSSGVGGNALATTINNSGNAVEPLTFGAVTLTGGSAGATCKLTVSARNKGSDGNSITVAETMSTDGWAGAATTLTGGADVDTETTGVKILGTYKIWSYGTWKGTVILERQRPDGSWEAVRQWHGNNDRNVAENGTAEYQQVLRFKLVDGVGSTSADEDIPRFVLEADDAKIYGLVRVTAYNDAQSVDALVIHDLHSTDATASWSEGAWSDYRGYPRALTIHDQRLFFFGTTNQPQSFWASATGDFYNFRRGTNDADGFTDTLAGEESSPIVWAQSIGAGMVIAKETEEWLLVSSDSGTSVTPTNYHAKRQSAYGSEPVSSVLVGGHVLFVPSGGRGVMAYQFAYAEQSFFAADLSELSEHLLKGRIKQMAFARKPDSIVWIVTVDGKLLSLSYRREKSEIAWAYHPMSGTVESVAAITGGDGLDDVYIATLRTINGVDVRFVERLDIATTIELDEDDIDDAARRIALNYLDCSFSVTTASATNFTGFDHLDGELVAVQADGAYYGTSRVHSGGTITLTRAATSVTAGIDYSDDSYLVPFIVDAPSNAGSSADRKWTSKEVSVRLYNTSALRYSDTSSGSELWEGKLNNAADSVNSPRPVRNGIQLLCTAPRTQDDIRVMIKPTNAEPCNILALIVSAVITG